MANIYLNRHYNGVYSQSIVDGIEDSFKATSGLIEYLSTLSIDTAREKELELIGKWIGYDRPYIPQVFLDNNAFLFFADEDVDVGTNRVDSPEHGFCELDDLLTGGRLLGEISEGVKLPLDMYREVLKAVSYIMYNGFTLDSLDRLLHISGVDYTMRYDSEPEMSTIGTTYNWTGTTYATKMCLVSIGDVAIIDVFDGNLELRMYIWNGDEWTFTGTALDFGSTVVSQITMVSDNTICVATATSLSTYTWNGSTTWSKVGNTLTFTSKGVVSITRIIEDTIAFIGDGDSKLTTYHWDGTDWASIGTQLTLVDVSTPAVTFLSDNIIALAEANNGELTTFTWSGSAWSTVGNVFNQLTLDNPSIATMSSNRIVILNKSDNSIRFFNWDGTDWTLDNTVSIEADTLGYNLIYSSIVGLNELEVVFNIGTSDRSLLVYHYYRGLQDILVSFTEEIQPTYLYVIGLVLEMFMTLPRVFLTTV
jgi:hypothetical protein